MNGMKVDIKVHPSVREFILCTNGSPTIVPQKDDWLWLILKQHLTTVAGTVLPVPRDEYDKQYISISLLDTSGTKVQVVNRSRVKRKHKGFDRYNIYMDSLFRCELNERGRNIIAWHLRTQFKECFHNFVQGALAVSPDLEQKQVIFEFCKLYNITMNSISEDMLRKSWQRSPQKYIIQDRLDGNKLKSKLVCPIIF